MPAAPIVIRADLLPNPDGSLRTTNAAGDFNPTPTNLLLDRVAFNAALGSMVGLVTGTTAVSLDLRGAWLTGTEATTCTFGIRSVSGDIINTHNWTIVGSVLGQSLVSPGSIGSGVLEIFAVDSTGHELSFGQISWSIAAPVGGTDVQAPTVPTGLGVTGASGALNCTIDAASDRYDGATPPSGMQKYKVYLDGVFNKNVTAAASPSIQMVATSIGSSSPAASYSNSGGVWSLTAAGVGVHNNTAEECLFIGAQLAGDASITVKVPAFSSAYQYSTAGVMARETLAQGAVFEAVYLQPVSPGLGFQAKARTVAGGKGLNIASVNAITSGWIKLKRTGSTFSASYSTNGITFTVFATSTIAMAASAYYGVFLSSQNAGVSCSAQFSEVNINTAPAVSFNVTTTGTHSVSVSSVDIANNESTQCTGVSGTATAVAANGAPSKLTGGVWWQLNNNISKDSQFAQIATIKTACPLTTGVQVFWQLADLENPNVPGDYSGNWTTAGQAGFQLIDRFLAECVRVGCKFALHIYTYGGSGTAGQQTTYRSGVLPTYMSGSAYGPNTPTTTGRIGGLWVNGNASFGSQTSVRSFVVWWEAPVAARFNEWGRNMALRYDSNATFEMLSFNDESAVPAITGWTVGAAKATLMGPTGLFATQRSYWANTRLRWWDNYVGNDDDMQLLQAEAQKYFWTMGGPDTAADPSDPSHVNPNNGYSAARTQSADYVYMGRGSTTATINIVNPNYTNKVGIANRVGQIEGEDLTANTPAGQRSIGDGYMPHIVAHANKLMCTDLFILWDDFQGPSYNRVNTAHPNLVDFVNSMLQGGAVNVNGVVAGITIINSGVRPSGW